MLAKPKYTSCVALVVPEDRWVEHTWILSGVIDPTGHFQGRQQLVHISEMAEAIKELNATGQEGEAYLVSEFYYFVRQKGYNWIAVWLSQRP